MQIKVAYVMLTYRIQQSLLLCFFYDILLASVFLLLFGFMIPYFWNWFTASQVKLQENYDPKVAL